MSTHANIHVQTSNDDTHIPFENGAHITAIYMHIGTQILNMRFSIAAMDIHTGTENFLALSHR